MKTRQTAWLALPAAAVLVLLGAAAKSPGGLDLATARLVDLTHPFDRETLYWPTSPTTFSLEKLSDGKTPGGWYYAANTFCAPEHGGTHLDAPRHFDERGWTADRIPIDRLIAPAIVLDVRKQAADDADYRLSPADVAAWEVAHGRIPSGAIVLLRTGWSARWPDRKKYLGSDTPGDASNLQFPSFGEASVKILLDRGIGALGVDTASIDYGPSKDFVVHRLVGAANVPAFENVANLEELPETGAWVLALPMKIAGGSGGPLRIAAALPPK
jgi:kynurenine formamidase